VWQSTFEAAPYGERGRYFFEPLSTTAPADAQPYCCYTRTVIFYKKPYRSDGRGNFVKYDEVETEWSLFGQRWTTADIGWSALAPFVEHEGQVYELGGGEVLWRDGRWVNRWLGWRVEADDPRLVQMREEQAHAPIDV
jgi:hypothetical protein